MADTNKLLDEVERKVVLVQTEKRDPKEFFKDREGLSVWSSFVDRVLVKAEAVEKEREFPISFYKLLEDSDDEAIEKALPENHIFSESEVSAIIAELISKQEKGEEGNLLNNGYANLFYTPSFVVGVYWDSFDGSWYVDAWHRGSRRWRAGRRVFSPAN